MYEEEKVVVKIEGDFATPMATIMKQAYDDAVDDKFKISEAVLSMAGMSGRTYRKFINNLVENMPDPRYLETGSLKGSTVCSAMYGNQTKVTCIESWHWDYRKEFKENTDSVRTDQIDFNFIESDFRGVDYHNIGKYNIYMFDGPHSARDQYDGVFLAQPALDDRHILIVDDWNWNEVQHGTWSAIKYLGLKVQSKIEVFTLNHSAENGNEKGNWHNGYLIAAIEK